MNDAHIASFLFMFSYLSIWFLWFRCFERRNCGLVYPTNYRGRSGNESGSGPGATTFRAYFTVLVLGKSALQNMNRHAQEDSIAEQAARPTTSPNHGFIK